MVVNFTKNDFACEEDGIYGSISTFVKLSKSVGVILVCDVTVRNPYCGILNLDSDMESQNVGYEKNMKVKHT